MFYINDDYYTSDYVAQRHLEFRRSDALANNRRLAVCLEDAAQWIALCLFIKEQGGSVMPIHPSTPLDAAKRMATRAGCEQLHFKEISNIIQLESPAVGVESPAAGVESRNQPDGVLIQMSSGTTGEPKCIERSWATIDEEIQSYCSAFTQPNDMMPLIACPVTHSYGLICGVLVALARGQQPIVITNINPKYLAKRLLSTQKPLLYTSPTMLHGLIRLLPKDRNIHAAMTSGTIMPKQRFEQLAPRIDHFFQQYGCSEAGCIAINPNMTLAMDVGIPLPHLDVVAGDSADNPAEIVVTTKQGQQIHTQDLGHFRYDAAIDGNMLSFLSRLDDTIIVAGLNVYPQEVEDVILTMPDINDAVVFKIEDPYAGQRVCVQYSADTPVEPSLIRQWCADRLAPFQLPQLLIQVEQVDRLANGKVNRKQLAIQFANQQRENRPAQIEPVAQNMAPEKTDTAAV
ncbi:AMP-binding protein [Alkalimarinus coralli]|uniref:AMP-binding protein n=1 Tax=Alkalimarinus coralli TaxID=2935863 RepID=UPI00202ACE1D|nr:AMP-binding protein [Alkalimarinus coralli]